MLIKNIKIALDLKNKTKQECKEMLKSKHATDFWGVSSHWTKWCAWRVGVASVGVACLARGSGIGGCGVLGAWAWHRWARRACGVGIGLCGLYGHGHASHLPVPPRPTPTQITCQAAQPPQCHQEVVLIRSRYPLVAWSGNGKLTSRKMGAAGPESYERDNKASIPLCIHNIRASSSTTLCCFFFFHLIGWYQESPGSRMM